MRRVQQTVEAKASGTRPRTSSPTMARLVRQTQMPLSAVMLMPMAQAVIRRSIVLVILECGLLGLGNS